MGALFCGYMLVYRSKATIMLCAVMMFLIVLFCALSPLDEQIREAFRTSGGVLNSLSYGMYQLNRRHFVYLVRC